MSKNLKEIMKKEFDKEKNYNEILSKVERVSNMKNFKMKYLLVPAVACVAIIGIAFGTNIVNNPQKQEIIADRNVTVNDKESNIQVALVINKLDNIGALKFDADTKTFEMKDLPEKYKFISEVTVPKEYKLETPYMLYTRENKDKDYNILHDYVFNYIKDDNHSIRIAISEIGEPIRDYYAEGEKVSKIGKTEIIICQYENLYIATFKDKQMNFDIETVGISETELTDLLVSIIK